MIKGRILFLFIQTIFAINCFAQSYIAAVKKDSLWGYIDEKGNVLIDFVYDDALNFSCGRALVKKGKEKFYIDINNNIISKNSLYECKGNFSNNRAIVIDKKTHKKIVINKSGEVIYNNKFIDDIFPYHHNLARIITNKRSGFIDTNGVLIIDTAYKFSYRFAGKSSFPLAYAKREDDQWIYLTKQGKEIIAPSGYEFKDYFYSRSRHNDEDKNDSVLLMIRKIVQIEFGQETYFGFCNQNSKIVIPAIYRQAMNFRENYAAVSLDEKYWGFIDNSGAIKIKPTYKNIKSFTDGIASVGKMNEKFIRPDGKIIYSDSSKITKGDFREGLIIITSGLYFGIMDTLGKTIIHPLYSKILPWKNGIIWVWNSAGWHAYDYKGNQPFKNIYNEVKEFCELKNGTEILIDEE